MRLSELCLSVLLKLSVIIGVKSISWSIFGLSRWLCLSDLIDSCPFGSLISTQHLDQSGAALLSSFSFEMEEQSSSIRLIFCFFPLDNSTFFTERRLERFLLVLSEALRVNSEWLSSSFGLSMYLSSLSFDKLSLLDRILFVSPDPYDEAPSILMCLLKLFWLVLALETFLNSSWILGALIVFFPSPGTISFSVAHELSLLLPSCWSFLLVLSSRLTFFADLWSSSESTEVWLIQV